VKDTDAEGRIILADALEYASKQNPDEILDFATLTGAIIYALGEFLAGLFTQNNDLADRIIASGENTYERVWRMPFGNEFNSHVDSKIADVANLGRGYGGAITAGKFLERFVDKDIPWAHMDIAGCAVKHKYKNYTKDYNTGFGVRLMVDYLRSL
jgi:leucyl aminopeptidase